jgi:hypothetical protein
LGASSSYKSNFNHGFHALSHIRTELNAGKAIVVGIDTPSSGCPCVGSHAYIVDSVNTIAGIPVSVTLRNPWGVDGGGSTDGVNDGLVTITATQLFDSMSGIRSATV